MFCPNCGFENDNNFRFCEQCGERLDELAAQIGLVPKPEASVAVSAPISEPEPFPAPEPAAIPAPEPAAASAPAPVQTFSAPQPEENGGNDEADTQVYVVSQRDKPAVTPA
ncbi:MAG: zinc ribbon domain-containing protein, partial [Ruminiclostridium sp.]